MVEVRWSSILTSSPAGEPFSPALRRSVGVVMIGASLSFLDSTVVNVALRTLTVDLHAGLGTVQWVVTAYLLALAAIIPVTGWAARRFGAARLYVLALVVFTVGSALIGVPIVLAPMLGPTIGGLLIQGIDWRAIFWLNVPFGLAGVVLALRLLPPGKGSRAAAGRLDVTGLILAAAGTVGITYGLSEIGAAAGFDTAATVSLFVGLVAVAGFVLHARRAERPLLDLGLYASRAFTAASITSFALGAAMFGGMILLPLYFQIVRGEDVILAGLLLAPSGLGAFIANRFSAPLTDRYGAGITALGGATLGVISTIPFVFLTATTPYTLLCVVMVIRGAGIGLSIVPPMTGAYRALPPNKIPDATPQLNVLQRVGGAIGTAVLTVILTDQLRHNVTPAGQASGFATTFLWVLAITIAAAIPPSCSPAPNTKPAAPALHAQGGHRCRPLTPSSPRPISPISPPSGSAA